MGDDDLKLLTKAQVAKRLHVSVRSVERLVSSGELQALKVGGSTRFDPRDVVAYVDGLRGERGGGRQ